MVTICQRKDRICMQEKDLPKMGWTLPQVRGMGARFYKKTMEVRFLSSVFWDEIGRAGIRSSVVSRRPDGIEWILYPKTLSASSQVEPAQPPESIVIPIFPVVTSHDSHPETDGQPDRKWGDDIVTEKKYRTENETCELSTQTDPNPDQPSIRSVIPWGVMPSTFQYRKDRPDALAALAEQLWAGLSS